MSQMERPTSLKRPPKPAPDSDIDPITTAPEASASSATQPDERPTAAFTPPAPSKTAAPQSAARRAGREVTVPISTRVAPDVVELLDAAVAREGITFRAAVEQAVRQAWGI